MPDWDLDRGIAQSIFMLLGQLEVNLMATSQSHQVELYFAALVDNKAATLDTFTENWSQFRLAYIFRLIDSLKLTLIWPFGQIMAISTLS